MNPTTNTPRRASHRATNAKPDRSQLPRIHFTPPYLLTPTNPITVRLIGAGGTGSQMLTGLVRLHSALRALDHPGLVVQLWDDDTVSEANLGRQLFAPGEIGLNKAVALINRVNRFLGSNWKAVPDRFVHQPETPFSGTVTNLTITCVDSLDARRQVAAYFKDMLGDTANQYSQSTDGPRRAYYWLDSGNELCTGQVILATVGKHVQRKTELFNPVASLPNLIQAYARTLAGAIEDTGSGLEGPSCSVADALSRQDLFINSTLADMACSLIWSLLRDGQTRHRGVFLNLGGFRSQPLMV